MTGDLTNKHVLVLGLGESGLAMARWCLREGARVRVADSREAPPHRDALTGVELVTGPFTEALLDGVGLVAISPGLSPNAEPQATLLIEAQAAGIPVCSEIELFARKLASLNADEGYAPRVVGITGTNGKTTVTRLVGSMCEHAGRTTVVAGNVSPAALDALADALDRRDAGGRLPDVWVLELSSFQLETTASLTADAATVLNVTEDHLDWHGDFAAYVRAKVAIFAPRTVRVLNRDDPVVLAMGAADAPTVRFGLDAPTVAGDLGVVCDRGAADGLRWIAVAEGDDPEAEARGSRRGVASGRRRGPRVAAGAVADVRVKRLMPVDALSIRGDHNVANVLAAIALGRAIGLPIAAMLRAAAAYRGEPHRVSLVASHGGIEWIDDSKGTNVGATVAALRGLGRKVVLIAGGLGKGQDFAPLAAPVERHARVVLLIGRDRDALRAALERTGVELVDCTSVDDAVERAAHLAEPGDAVLLSPACGSQDMFRDYAHRADVFVAAVRRVASTEAVAC